jgi:hypothetical protein
MPYDRRWVREHHELVDCNSGIESEGRVLRCAGQRGWPPPAERNDSKPIVSICNAVLRSADAAGTLDFTDTVHSCLDHAT